MVTDYSDVKLETKDLILKKAEFEDWKTIYYNLWRHKESAKYMLWQPTETDEDAKDRMKRTPVQDPGYPIDVDGQAPTNQVQADTEVVTEEVF